MWNWEKVKQTGNYKYLYKFGLDDFTKESKEKWNDIFNTYIHFIGLGDEQNRLLELKLEYLMYRSDYVSNDDIQAKMKSKFIAIDIEDLQAVMSARVSSKEHETTIVLEKNIGREIDLKKITVQKYYQYIEFYTNKAKQVD